MFIDSNIEALETYNNIILNRYSIAIFYLMFHQLRKKCEGLLLKMYNISLTNYHELSEPQYNTYVYRDFSSNN